MVKKAVKKYPQGIIKAVAEARQVLASYEEVQIQEVQLYHKARNSLVSLWYDDSVPEFDLGHDLSELKRDWISSVVENEIMEADDFEKILEALDTLATLDACAYA